MGQIEELPDDFDEQAQPTSPPAQPLPPPSSSSSSFPPSPSTSLPSSTSPKTMEPALPPALAAHRDKGAAEILASLNRTPLFMTDLDETDGSGGENVELEALKALAYEGAPLEVAANFREQGNDCFRARQWSDAAQFYTKGVLVLGEDRRKRKEGEGVDGEREGVSGDGGKRDGEAEEDEDEDEEEGKMKKMEEALLLNRAACNLELQNYRRTIQDCAGAIRLNPSSPSPKAYYRTTMALLRLSRLDEAEDALEHALRLAPHDAALQRLRREVDARRAKDEEERRRRAERDERASKEKKALRDAIRARGWVVVNTAGGGGGGGGGAPKQQQAEEEAVDLQDATVSLADPLDPESVLHVPLLFLYPMAAQSDFIKSVPETASVTEQLEYVLPVPWEDSSASIKEYGSVNEVECFAETMPASSTSTSTSTSTSKTVRPDLARNKGLIKVGKKIAIGTVLGPSPPTKASASEAAGSTQDVKRVVPLVDGMLKLFVVPKGKTKEFVEEYKRRMGR